MEATAVLQRRLVNYWDCCADACTLGLVSTFSLFITQEDPTFSFTHLGYICVLVSSSGQVVANIVVFVDFPQELLIKYIYWFRVEVVISLWCWLLSTIHISSESNSILVIRRRCLKSIFLHHL